jgi:ABC-type phosphate/phosphonate transport system ATPase subunit
MERPTCRPFLDIFSSLCDEYQSCAILLLHLIKIATQYAGAMLNTKEAEKEAAGC